MRLLFLLLLLLPVPAFCADSLMAVIPAKGRLISMDELGNVYLLRADNI